MSQKDDLSTIDNMKNMFALLLALDLYGVTTASSETYDTNAQLPNDRLIWPMGKVEKGPDTLELQAIFLGQKKVLSYNQGKWRNDIYVVTYKLKEANKKFAEGTIRFLAKDFNPAEGSNIKLKKLAWPFRKGEMTFYLDLDDKVKFRDFFQIVSYKSDE